MSNSPISANFDFDVELSLAGPFSGVPQLIGVLKNEPVILLIKNQSTVTAFISTDNAGTKGTTMVAGENIILDLRGNKGSANNGGFPIGRSFFATATDGTGDIKISIIFAT
jgi:hypothetical protein